MRLKQRRNVLLPQPDGPISAVTWFSGTASVMLRSAWFVPYQKLSLREAAFSLPTALAGRSPIVIDTEGVSGFCVGASRCIGAACLGSGTAWVGTSVCIVLTS